MNYSFPPKVQSLIWRTQSSLSSLSWMLRLTIGKALGIEPAPTELIVFFDERAARVAGFKGQRHPKYRYMWAWWPGLGIRGLMGRTHRRVTVTADMLRIRTPERENLAALLKHRQFAWRDKAIWIEL